LTLKWPSHLLSFSIVRLYVPKKLLGLQDTVSHLLQFLFGDSTKPEHLPRVAVGNICKVSLQRLSDASDVFEHLLRNALHIEEIDSIRFGWFGELVHKTFDVREML
jgi:hypothetical protein